MATASDWASTHERCSTTPTRPSAPSIFRLSPWRELGETCQKDRVTLALPFEEWARAAFASGKYHEAELTTEIVYVAQRLNAISERGDRLIAATAVALDLPLITHDPQIAAAAGVECLWA